MNKDKFKSREVAEKGEGLEQVDNQVPENRMQSKQQIQNTSAAQAIDVPKSSFSKGSATGKGTALKQEKISEALTGSVESAGMGINAAGRGVSGTFGGVLGANNSTPTADQTRRETRVGKKLERVANKLNYTPCEQTIVAVKESKPLADAATEDQGYNGTYRNEDARSQKIMGAVPGDLMYQRSVDFIEKDKLYFLEGQQVYQREADRTDFNPSKVYDSSSGSETWVDQTMTSGNYLHSNMQIQLDDSGDVKSIYFGTHDVTPGVVSAEEANTSSAHRLIKSNVAELDRMNMDAKAGDEKADIWTPLARAIKEPTKWSYLMSSIEAETAGYVHLAYSKASTNMAFQLNRAPKDGLDTVGPAIEQFIGWRSTENNSVDLQDGKSLSDLFSSTYYDQADPQLMIAAYDSPRKYNSKADLLLQPRGWRMHLQTADNNMNSLHLPKEYANVYAATEAYSTIGRDYDPILPICFTDKANIILNHNLNEYGTFGYVPIRSYSQSYTATKITKNKYAYNKLIVLSNSTVNKFDASISAKYIFIGKTDDAGVDGLEFDASTGLITFKSDSNNGSKVVKVIIKDNDTIPVETNMAFTKLSFTLDGVTTYDFSKYDKDVYFYAIKVQDSSDTKVSAATLTTTEDDITVTYENRKPLKYMYSDLRNNYVVNVKHPFIFGIIEYLKNEIGAKLYTLLSKDPDTGFAVLNIPLVFSTKNMTLAQLFICAATPWIQRVRENSMKDLIYYEDNVHEYPYSKLASIKDVPFKNYSNFGFSDYDHPLEAKVMNPVQSINWIMPEFFWKIADSTYVLPWYFNQAELCDDGTVNDDASAMSMPSIRAGIHFDFFDTLYGMSEKDIRLSLDRMTKEFYHDSELFNSFMVYKYGRTTDGQPVAILNNNKDITVQKILSTPRELGLEMDCPLGVLTKDPLDSGAYKSFTADGTATSYRIRVYTNVNTILSPSILASSGINIDRAANYTQKWIEVCANNDSNGQQIAGLIFGMNDDDGEFSPLASLSTDASAGSTIKIHSLQRSINTRLQFLPFIISPFDGSGITGNNFDIYDFAYYFGLAGFRASDYRESVYNREKEVINQGFLFVEDPWILSSPILKDSSAAMGLSMNKGYSLS